MHVEFTRQAENKSGRWRHGKRLSGTFERDAGVWRAAIAALWLFGGAAVALAALGMPTGFGAATDATIGVALHTIAYAASSSIIAALLKLARLKAPRATIGGFVYTGIVVGFILYYSEFGWKGAAFYSTAAALTALGLGLLAGAIARMPRARIAASALAALSIAYALAGFPAMQSGTDAGNGKDGAYVLSAGYDAVSDPSTPGEYAVRSFTYGSGTDKQRPEYGAKTTAISDVVDASAYIDSWPWLREKFWGFDESELPLNGRVWMPDGAGPFPVVLMVHGNHLMEKFSDAGYGYLGELLASRGFVAISIDENFFNYSVWSGIPDRDMELRAWLLLKHIGQLQRFAADPESPFYGKIDFERAALLGHSRGGQAAAMATDRERWYPDDEGLPAADSYKVRAVVELAPTDTLVDGKRSELKDISYLTLQGAKDADIVNFYGDRQYGRVSFTGGATAEEEEPFKASLYIEDANHSQFNTDWGLSDNSLPTALFIRPEGLLEPEQQRHIAKAYVSAFLQASLTDDEAYDRLFQDYRTGLGFLPDTRYFNQYESGGFRRLADFGGSDREELSYGVTAEASNLTDWRHVDAQDRQGEGKGDGGVVLAWDREGRYAVRLSDAAAAGIADDPVLVFSLANMAEDVADEAGVKAEEPLSIDVEVKDELGHAVRLPLNEFMDTEPQAATSFTWLPGMEAELSDGKFKDAEEAVYQTYELPLERFAQENGEFDPEEWSEVTFYFNDGPGKVMLDELGWMPE
ncbi:alpha/beta hydrolase family protein [Cohnella suwonensis]|uniref:Alpha/beta hydrolase family protein n=1 Tax=Cohnella suwonensis TaxID=696072 RepID=A0ABW0LWQ1_9BACL